jgi:long-chain acyl-CoA synthetase
MYHAGPLQSVWLAAAGTPVIIPKKFDAARMLDLIEQYGVTNSLMVPTHLVRFLAAREERRVQGRPEAEISTLEHITLTGSMCPPDVKRAIIDWWGPVIYEGYGGTESGGICYISAEEWLQRPTSVGRARTGFRIVVVDEDGAELPPNTDGRLYFEDLSGRGIEYLDSPAATASAHLRPGVFTLGEIGHVDDEGYVYITDRDSEKIVSGGVNLYPAEVERVLLDHPEVEDAVVIGVRDHEMGEKVCALVVPAPGVTVDVAALTDFCVQRLSRLKAPRYIHLLEELPRITMGKANRRKIREEFEPIVLSAMEAQEVTARV